ncbi:MAG: glycosyltransferase [Proteobacteria bacterium]|nr:glycosyltransferase [Pseudomonadota bacterium]MBI3499080.1 glycosyltransferase [Pseudomonadota bacterium]
MSVLLAIGALALAFWVYLLAARGGFWRERVAPACPPPPQWPEVVAVVPARNEAYSIGRAVHSLLTQDYPGRFRVIVVDDHSEDETAALARRAAADAGQSDRLEVISARPLPQGWTGKLWAVAEGLERAETTAEAAGYALLTDADVVHAQENLAELVARAERDSLDLVSLMVRLQCETFAERALIPGFVFFFQMIYPFRWVNRSARKTAAAAGGCMLVRRRALGRIGGIASIRGALIDDCALARAIKAGGSIWLGLASETVSLRVYRGFGDIARMVARSAYTQLKHSPVLLALTIVGTALVFLGPPALALGSFFVDGAGLAGGLGWGAWALMTLSLLPTLSYYRVSFIWALALPAIALFYLAATLQSALQHRLGRGGQWKGRIQAGAGT